MPIVIAEKKRFQGHIRPEALNKETVIIEIPGESDDYIVEGYIDLRELQEGDEVGICEYIAVDGSTPSAFICVTFRGRQEQPVIRFHTKTLLSNMLYKVVLKQLYGYLREIYYGFIVEVMGTA